MVALGHGYCQGNQFSCPESSEFFSGLVGISVAGTKLIHLTSFLQLVAASSPAKPWELVL